MNAPKVNAPNLFVVGGAAMDDAGVERIQRSSSLAEQAYQVLRRATRRGALSPGRVYSELEVADLLGISRTPVREAIAQLERQGVLTKVRQRGFRLRELGDDERDEAYALRGLIESYVVGRLAREATDEGVEALREIVDRQEQALDDLTEFDEIGERLHLEMASQVGPVWTAQIIEMLRGIVWLSGLDAISLPGRPQEDVDEHRRIVEAVAEHNRRAAERALMDHLDATANAARRRRAERVRTAGEVS